MATLSVAEKLVNIRHADQKDIGGQPYVGHLQRVSANVKTPIEKIVGLMHDVIEDTDCTYQELRDLGFSEDVLIAIECLTKRAGENRIEAAHRAAANRIACAVKIADVTDNMDISRIPNPKPRDYERLEEYKRVLEILMDAKMNRWGDFEITAEERLVAE